MTKEKLNILLIAWFFGLLDVLTTIKVLELGGSEINPIYRLIGSIEGLILFKVVCFIISSIIIYREENEKEARQIGLIIIIYMIIIVSINTTNIVFLGNT